MKKKVTSCGTATIRRARNKGYEVLLVKPNQSSDWGFPKGHVEEGETHESTAVRETLEETGIDVTIDFLLGQTSVSRAHESKTVIIYVATPTDAEQCIAPTDNENSDIRWWPVDNLPTLHRYQNTLVQSLKDVVESMNDTEEY